MHAYAARAIECRVVTVSLQPAPCTCGAIWKPSCSTSAFIRSVRFPTHKRSAFPTAAVCRASTSSNGAGYPRQTVTSDRDGTLGPQARVSANDAVNLSSSVSRPPVAPSVLRSYEVPLWDAMKFNGPAPEIINGRLAMLGIIAAAVNEANYSETVVQQLPHVQFRLILMTLLVSYSSLIPILKGAKSEAFGIFTPRAEITNGRAAMLGFAVLLLLENKSGVPFF